MEEPMRPEPAFSKKRLINKRDKREILSANERPIFLLDYLNCTFRTLCFTCSAN
jgi:hypothetical protein